MKAYPLLLLASLFLGFYATARAADTTTLDGEKPKTHKKTAALSKNAKQGKKTKRHKKEAALKGKKKYESSEMFPPEKD